MHTPTSSAICLRDSHALIQAGPIEEERSYVKSAPSPRGYKYAFQFYIYGTMIVFLPVSSTAVGGGV